MYHLECSDMFKADISSLKVLNQTKFYTMAHLNAQLILNEFIVELINAYLFANILSENICLYFKNTLKERERKKEVRAETFQRSCHPIKTALLATSGL